MSASAAEDVVTGPAIVLLAEVEAEEEVADTGAEAGLPADTTDQGHPHPEREGIAETGPDPLLPETGRKETTDPGPLPPLPTKPVAALLAPSVESLPAPERRQMEIRARAPHATIKRLSE